MAYEFQTIKNITLPTGTSYSLKDAQAQLILAGFADAEGSVKAYIDQMADLAFDVIVLTVLPHPTAPTEEDYDTYKNKIVLIPDEDAEETGAYLEYVIVRTGTVGSYTYAWEPIGTTQVDLSEYLTDVSYTDATHTLSKTKNGTTSAVHQFGALADKSNATGSYTKPTGTGTADVPTYENYNSDLLLVIENEDKEEFVQSVTATKNSSAITASVSGGSVTSGSQASFTQGSDSFTQGEDSFTPASIANGFVTPGSQASFTQGAKASFTQGAKASFTQGAKASLSTSVANETLTINFTPNGDDTFVANGDDTFTPNGNDTFTANTPTAIDTTKFSGGSFTQGTDSFAQGTDSFTANTPTAVTLPTTATIAPDTVVVDVDDSDKAEALIDANLSTDDGSSTSKSVSVTTSISQGSETTEVTVSVGTVSDTVTVA